jgi:hypothetical protein
MACTPSATRDLLVIDAYIADLRRDAGWVAGAQTRQRPRSTARTRVQPARTGHQRARAGGRERVAA